MSLAQNTVVNMAEDFTMMVGYSVVLQWLNEQLEGLFPDEVDVNGKPQINFAKEVLAGGLAFLFMSAVMEAIRREEKIIQYLFAAGEALITVLYLRNKGVFDGIKNKIKNNKGVRALSRLKLLDSQTDNQNSFISQVYQAMQTILQGRNSSHDVANTVSAVTGQMDHAINKEAHAMKFARANNQSFKDSIMIKMFTGTFTESDKLILKKIIGRDNFASVPLDIEELNTFREFAMVKDSAGNFTGLSRAFTDMINGLGFVHNR